MSEVEQDVKKIREFLEELVMLQKASRKTARATVR